MHDLVIDNALLIDGTGAPARHGSLAVADGRIAAIGERCRQRARSASTRTGSRSPRASSISIRTSTRS